MIMHPGFGNLYTSGVAELRITSSCTYRCIFCDTLNGQGYFQDRVSAILAVDALKDLGFEQLVIAGGDPLMHPDFKEICAYARAKDFITAIATHGSLLNCDTIEEIRDDVDWMIIPADSPFESTEERLGRGNGNHLSHLEEISDMIRDEGIKLHLYSVITALNANESLWLLADALVPDLWTFVLHYYEVRRWRDHYGESNIRRFFLDEAQIRKFMRRHQDMRLPNGLRPSFVYSDELLLTAFTVRMGWEKERNKNI